MRALVAVRIELVREGLGVVLQRLEERVAVTACDSFADALEAAKKETFDLVLLDRDLRDMDGIAGIAVFHGYFPAPRLLVLADEVRRAEVLEAMKHGAVGFLPKDLSSNSLLSAVRLVLSGESYVPAELLSSERLSGSMSGPEKIAMVAFETLTEREADVLEQLLVGFTNKEIGRVLDIQEITVKLHLRGIYRKLGVKNRAQAVARSFGAGWLR